MSDFGPAGADRRRLGVPGPVPARGRRRPEQDQVGADRQPQPRRHRRRLGRPVLRRRLRRHDASPADNVAGAYTPPAGELVEDFEGADLRRLDDDRQRVRRRPGRGQRARRRAASAATSATGLANSFHDEDRGTGTLTSPDFTITRPYLNFLVGGGNHPHDPATVDAPPPDRARCSPTSRATPTARAGRRPARSPARGRRPARSATSSRSAATWARQLVNTFIDHDNGTGHITSPEFTISSDYINFLIGGGNHPYPGDATNPPTAVEPPRRRPGRAQRHRPGQRGAQLDQLERRASSRARPAQIDIVDENTGGWGHINADQFTFVRRAGPPALDRDRRQPARRRQGRPQRHRPQQRDARLGHLEPARPRRQERADPARRHATPAAGATSWPTTSPFADAAGALGAAAQQLDGLRQGLLRRGHLERRARRPADRDRLDEQLELRRRDPHLALAQRA